MTFVPQWLMPIVLIIHGYEGLLVVIVAVVWHLYDVHISPRNFPMSEVWLTGKMPLEKARRYHKLEHDRLTAGSKEENE
jgi:hypothetical protein